VFLQFYSIILAIVYNWMCILSSEYELLNRHTAV